MFEYEHKRNIKRLFNVDKQSYSYYYELIKNMKTTFMVPDGIRAMEPSHRYLMETEG